MSGTLKYHNACIPHLWPQTTDTNGCRFPRGNWWRTTLSFPEEAMSLMHPALHSTHPSMGHWGVCQFHHKKMPLYKTSYSVSLEFQVMIWFEKYSTVIPHFKSWCFVWFAGVHLKPTIQNYKLSTGKLSFELSPDVDPTLRSLVLRITPLCQHYSVVVQVRSQG